MLQPPEIIMQIVHIQGPLQGEIQEFAASEISIGRDPACEVCFPAGMTVISRRHARIVRDGNRFRLVDSSTNGTLVNGKAVKEIYLKDGDVITLSQEGPKLSFLTRISEGKNTAKEQPSRPSIVRPSTPPIVDQPAVEYVSASNPQGPSSGPQSPAFPAIKAEPPPVQFPSGAVEAPLVIQYGPTLRCFERLPVKVGRGRHCDVVIEIQGMSEEQAVFYYVNSAYWVKDLSGVLVVKVNGSPVGGGAMLQAGDQVELGPRGPGFRFLGEGRLIEEEEKRLESVPENNNVNRDNDNLKSTNVNKNKESLFSRLFRKQ